MNELFDKYTLPEREACCGMAVSVGGGVTVLVGVDVGSGVAVSVEVGAMASGPLQAVNKSENNAKVAENWIVFDFIVILLVPLLTADGCVIFFQKIIIVKGDN